MRRSLMVVVALVAVLVAGVASGQDAAPARVPAYLALARICVSEAGWTCWETGDGYAIHEVLLRGSVRHGMRYVTYARAYSSRVMGARTHDSSRLRWVGGLRADGGEPSGWPEITTRRVGDSVRVSPGPSWSSYRERWLAVLARAREVVGWSLDDADEWSVCDGPVHDWGGAMDRARAERIGLIPVECGDTANDFYARPSLVGVE